MTNAPTKITALVGIQPARTPLVTSFHYGESVKVVQRRLGHSSAAITLDTYAHLWPDSDDRTRDAVEAALSAPADPVRTELMQDGL